ncbi:MAG: alpha/beta fold hydrolase [Candidatus Hodarchaeota archaeon]
MTEFFADINGIRLCYEVKGKGKPVFLVHGFGSKKESWMAQFVPLAEHFEVIRYDCRGTGKSERPDQPYTMDLFVEDLNGLMDFLKIQTAYFIGFSLGGTILQNFALKYPDKVEKLVLISSIAKIPEGGGPEAYVKSRLEGLELLKRDPEAAFWSSTILGFYYKFRKKMVNEPKKKFYGLWSAEDLLNYFKTDPPTPQDIKNLAHALKTQNTFNSLHEIKQKTLILAASHDRLVPKSIMLEIHERIPNSLFKVIDKAGHEYLKSKASEVNNIIINFLKD